MAEPFPRACEWCGEVMAVVTAGPGETLLGCGETLLGCQTCGHFRIFKSSADATSASPADPESPAARGSETRRRSED